MPHPLDFDKLWDEGKYPRSRGSFSQKEGAGASEKAPASSGVPKKPADDSEDDSTGSDSEDKSRSSDSSSASSSTSSSSFASQQSNSSAPSGEDGAGGGMSRQSSAKAAHVANAAAKKEKKSVASAKPDTAPAASIASDRAKQIADMLLGNPNLNAGEQQQAAKDYAVAQGWGQADTVSPITKALLGLVRKDFDESKHPRASNGRWGAGSGTASASHTPHGTKEGELNAGIVGGALGGTILGGLAGLATIPGGPVASIGVGLAASAAGDYAGRQVAQGLYRAVHSDSLKEALHRGLDLKSAHSSAKEEAVSGAVSMAAGLALDATLGFGRTRLLRAWAAHAAKRATARGAAYAGGEYAGRQLIPYIKLHTRTGAYDAFNIQTNFTADIVQAPVSEYFSSAIPFGVGDNQGSPPAVEGDEFTVHAVICKIDEDQRIVYGWASVNKEGGNLVTDWQGDQIDTKDLVDAAHDFMLNSRTGGDMHNRIGTGEVVESLVMTPEVQKALGIDLGKEGWFIGMKIHDDNAWGRVRSGELKEFSIGGNGYREPV